MSDAWRLKHTAGKVPLRSSLSLPPGWLQRNLSRILSPEALENPHIGKEAE